MVIVPSTVDPVGVAVERAGAVVLGDTEEVPPKGLEGVGAL